MGRDRPRAVAPSTDQPADANAPAPVAPQGNPDTAQPNPVVQGDSLSADGLVELRRSDERAPERDLATIQERIREGAPGTYLLQVLEQQDYLLMRWPDRRAEPLRVWIEPSTTLPNWSVTYPVVAEHAFEEWRVAGFPVRFDMVRDSASADITIRWIHQFPPDEGPRIGMARKKRDQHGWILQAEITIATHDRDGRPLRAETVGGTARHEVGHVLGLAHSNNPGDVMFPESRTPRISGADRATLRLLYFLPPGLVK